MSDILTQIVEKRKNDISHLGITFGFEIPSERARKVHKFLSEKGVILEVKRASPSKGDIAPDLDSALTARSYAEAGAAAISCLTETNYFKGTLGDLMNVCAAVDDFEKETGRAAPAVLRKDFLLSAEEVEIAYRAGADAVLLIARILESGTMQKMAETAASHKMTSLVEVRTDDDLQKLSELAEYFTQNKLDKSCIVCGVNSRDLANFKIDLLKPCALLGKIRAVLGNDARVIFESGIRTPESASFAGSLGFTGMLLGEAAAKNPELRTALVENFVKSKTTPNADFWNEMSRTLSGSNQKSSPLVKICGLTRAEDVFLADSLGATFTGFIFAEGFARNACDGTGGVLAGSRFEKILSSLKSVKAKKVAVVTDLETPQGKTAVKLVQDGVLDCLQLHGIPYSKVAKDILALPHYFALTKSSPDTPLTLFEKGEPRFLQDSKAHDFDKENPHLWIAGGLTPENAPALAKTFHPELIDLSGGIEEDAVGIKSEEKMRELFKGVKG